MNKLVTDLCKCGIAVVGVLVAALLCFSIYSGAQRKLHAKTTISSSNVIERIMDNEEVRMAKVPFNGIAEKKVLDKNGLERDLYLVRYCGFVTLGTDERIAFDKNDAEKIIRVRVPDPKVLDIEVDFDSIDYIFTKKKYETEMIAQDSYRVCLDDMSEEVKNNESIYIKDKKNTENIIRALLKPAFEEYTIEME